MGNVLLWTAVAVGTYLAIGVVVTVVLLSQTPYSDNGWLWLVLLWPLFVYAIFFG